MIAIGSPIVEALSWRIAERILMLCGDGLSLIETHPGDGQYDCLSFYRRFANPSDLRSVHLNRNGSLHVTSRDDAIQSHWPSLWADAIANPNPMEIAKRVAAAGHLDPSPAKPGDHRPAVARMIASLLAVTAYTPNPSWCRNGYSHSSGMGGSGPNDEWFTLHRDLEADRQRHLPGDPLGIPEYRYWFLMDYAGPQMCFANDGTVYAANGARSVITEPGVFSTLLAVVV
jgi:hypothetical protein